MKKISTFLAIIFLCGSFFILVKSQTVQATEQKQYESPAGVGFYGSYEYPSDTSSSSEELVSSDESVDSSISNMTVEQPISDKDQLENELIKKSLPSTGEIVHRYIGLIGILILVIVLLITFINKKTIWGKE